MRISLIVNKSEPKTLEQIRDAVEELRGAGHEVTPRLTFEGGDAQRMAREACEAGSDLIIASGGDGTVNQVINGIHDWKATDAGAAAQTPRFGIIPLGTANDFANALEIPLEVKAAIETAVSGTPLEVDVGRVNDLCFLNVSTGGFGAEATEEASKEVKRVLGPLAYLVTGVKKFATLQPLHARFTTGEELVAEGSFLLFAVGNCRRTGGGNWLTPEADLTDGLLDLCLVREMSRVDFVKLLPQLRAGDHIDHPDVIYRQLPDVTVEAQEELSVNADGEPLSGKRFGYRLSEHKVEVMTGREEVRS